MEVLTRHEGNCLEFFLKGELDHHGAQGLLLRLEQDIQKTLPMVLILDFTDVGFMDSSGIGLIIGRTKKLKYFNDSSVSVCNMSDRVDKLLKCAGIYTIVHKL